ncbi:dihydrolipoamide acetyltransferase family protein [Prauserella oleivorans]|uniref:Dihydrolipoamide acetyltransferase component of pyruvate dehydrogenase complex n=1 Tax=Prauserella oleivorans TaxID=1478153 RepID=A0ABW5W835_9PSEU
MPKMSMTMTEGVFVAWRKTEGEPVRQGEVVCEVTTDKVDMEVEATVDGVLTRLVAEPEDVIAVGEPIAYVSSEADDLLDGLFDGPAPDPGPRDPAAEPDVRNGEPVSHDAEPVSGNAEPVSRNGEPVSRKAEPVSRNGAGPRAVPGIAAVPAARRLAAERGIDLASVTPTGPWRTIRLADLPAAGGARPRNGRAAIARRMSASAQVPQFVLYRDVDLEAAASRRGSASWTVVFTKVLATALRRHPGLNASWGDGAPVPHEHVAVALAVDTPRGLLAPVLTDPDRDALDVLADRIDDVVARARGGRLGLAELTAPASSTLSNLGGSGVGGFQALLTPPQPTALAVGTVEPKVVPVPGGVGVRLRCTLGLSVDHRVADGVAGARLLGTIQELLDGELV